MIYWEKRAESVAKTQHRITDKYVADRLKREYSRASRNIQDQINIFYARFAENNEIDLTEARKLLTSDELEDFKMDLKEFRELAKNNPDGKWTQKLNNASYKVRVSRLEALKIQVEAQVQALNMAQDTQMTSLLSEGYQDTYYRTLYEIQKGVGMGTSFAVIDTAKAERIVKIPWLEQNYSQRIWGDNNRLVRQLDTELTQAIIRGDNGQDVTKRLSERMGVGFRNARRLVVTEMSHIQSEATFHSYRESGVVQQYEFLATLDEKTCDICGPLDGKVFKLSEKEAGVNANPLHPYCRCTTVPYFDEINAGERIARDAEGVSYYVPDDMSYEQWKKEHVGLASDDGKRDNNSEKLRLVQKIEPKEIPKAVKTYEDTIRHAEVENAYVIRPNGEVYTKGGIEAWISFSEDEVKQMKDAVVTHNHPANVTEWSFSRDDLRLYVESSMKELRATDKKFTYSITGRSEIGVNELTRVYEETRFTALDRIIEKGYNIELVDEYIQHERIKIVADKAGLRYRRWSVE